MTSDESKWTEKKRKVTVEKGMTTQNFGDGQTKKRGCMQGEPLDGGLPCPTSYFLFCPDRHDGTTARWHDSTIDGGHFICIPFFILFF